MPASKTAGLEKRIVKLEQELAAYKRQLSKQAPGENASARELAALREFARAFFRTAQDHGLAFWIFHPDVARAAAELATAAGIDDVTPTPTSKRTPQ